MSLETNPPSEQAVEAAGLNEAGVQHVDSDGTVREPQTISADDVGSVEVLGLDAGEPIPVTVETMDGVPHPGEQLGPTDGSIPPAQYVTPRDLLAEQEADDAPIVPRRTLVIPVVPDATGFGSSSFGLNLSPTAAQGLINLIAGLGRAGVKFHDASGAIGWVLEQLA